MSLRNGLLVAESKHESKEIASDFPVVDHIEAFGGLKRGEKKDITKETMQELFYSIGDSYEEAVSRADRVDFGALLKGIRCPFAQLKFSALAGLGFVHDPDDSGIMKKDGTIDEVLLQKLQDKAIDYNGQKIITEVQTTEFVRAQMIENRKNYKSPNCLSKMFSPCLRKAGAAASAGEFHGFWQRFPRDRTATGVLYTTPAFIGKFYKNSHAAIEELQAIVREERMKKGEPLTFAEAKANAELLAKQKSKCWSPFR